MKKQKRSFAPLLFYEIKISGIPFLCRKPVVFRNAGDVSIIVLFVWL